MIKNIIIALVLLVFTYFFIVWMLHFSGWMNPDTPFLTLLFLDVFLICWATIVIFPLFLNKVKIFFKLLIVSCILLGILKYAADNKDTSPRHNAWPVYIVE